MSPNDDPRAACDRLARLFQRVLELQDQGRRADDTVRAPLVPFVLAQLRMRVGPALTAGWAGLDPVHVVLCGGTNTGKSTVLNLLLGRAAAGMGVRARLSQHPEAYRPEDLGDAFLDAFPGRFEGYRRYRDEHPPRQSDDELKRDGYRRALAVVDPERLPAPARALAPPIAGSVLWDAPDFSTEEAQTYLGTVLDLLALADLVVLTVTDESYADDRGHVLLRLLGGSAAELIVGANKWPDAPESRDDLARALAVSGRIRPAIVCLPFVAGASPEDRLARLLQEQEAAALRQAVTAAAARGVELKRQALAGAVGLVVQHWDELVGPLAAEAAQGRHWTEAVDRITRAEVLGPYRREYLEGVRYGEFNRALVHLMTLLRVPVIGPVLDVAGQVVRLPVRLVSWLLGKAKTGAEGPAPPPEREVLGEALQRWLGALKAEAMSLEATRPHPAWAEIVRQLGDDRVKSSLLDRFEVGYAAYRAELDHLVRLRAEEIHRQLEQDPKRLNMLRGANLAASAASVGLVIKSAGLNWSDAVLAPAAAGLWRNLVEWGLGRYLEGQRSGLKEQQAEAIETLVADRLAEPARGLFRGAISADDLDAARRDLEIVAEAVARVAGGGPP